MSRMILCTCHGTVDQVEDLPAFLTNIRRGRPTPKEIVDEVTHRFQKIGGSPLMRITAAQAAGLEARVGVPVRIAARLWKPYPADVLAAMKAEGATSIVSLPLAPQSVDVYHAGVKEAGDKLGLEVLCAPSWGLEPKLIDAFVEVVEEGLARFEAPKDVGVILSAHSLPKRIIDMGDSYERDFRAMAEQVAARLRAQGNEVWIAFQSQGMTGDVWLGPDLAETFALVLASGRKEALIAPIGFVSDHVETLYDLDIEAHQIAARSGLARLERAAALNTRPTFIEALVDVARPLLSR